MYRLPGKLTPAPFSSGDRVVALCSPDTHPHCEQVNVAFGPSNLPFQMRGALGFHATDARKDGWLLSGDMRFYILNAAIRLYKDTLAEVGTCLTMPVQMAVHREFEPKFKGLVEEAKECERIVASLSKFGHEAKSGFEPRLEYLRTFYEAFGRELGKRKQPFTYLESMYQELVIYGRYENESYPYGGE